ncbi:hypothetical protein AFLA70_549g000351 [Aspergillus flavus AF70]|nr:hypothetical protein AFLA70_549g000351 [Aspergillus flavus AF70]
MARVGRIKSGLAAFYRRDRRSKNNEEVLRVDTPHHPPGKSTTYRHVPLELLPFFVAKNKGPLRSRRDGLGVDWPLGFTGSRRRHGHGSNKARAGRVGS